ncbi:MAG: hypothetical protein HY816_10405 [Candidatus Wallbacteria bacterium]|nr:hypothetical protein [Candidatus Wallbacteria bacterium]
MTAEARATAAGVAFLVLAAAAPLASLAGTTAWGTLVALALAAFVGATWRSAEMPAEPWNWRLDGPLTAYLLALALLLRVPCLQSVPITVNADEGVDGNTILDILEGKPVGLVATENFRGETIGFAHVAAAFGRMLGEEVWVFRLPVALTNGLGCPALYALLRLLHGRGAAAAGAVWFALSGWNICFARLINGMGEIPGLAAVALLLACLAVKLRSVLLALAAGLVTAAIAHVHLAGLLLAGTLLPLGLVVSRAVDRPDLRRTALLSGAAALGLLLGLAPLWPWLPDVSTRLLANSVLGATAPQVSVADVFDVFFSPQPRLDYTGYGAAWALPWIAAGLLHWIRRLRRVGIGALGVPLLWIVCLAPPFLAVQEPFAPRRLLFQESVTPMLAAAAVAATAAAAPASLLTRLAPFLACMAAFFTSAEQLSGPLAHLLDQRTQTWQERILRYGAGLSREFPVAVPLFAISYPDFAMVQPVAHELSFLMRLYDLREIRPGSSLAHRGDGSRIAWHRPEGFPEEVEDDLRRSLGNLSRWTQRTQVPAEFHLWHVGGDRHEYLQRGLRRSVYREAPGGFAVDIQDAIPLDAPIPADAKKVSWSGSLYCPDTGWYELQSGCVAPVRVDIDGRLLREGEGRWKAERLLHRGYHELSVSWLEPAYPVRRMLELSWRQPGHTASTPLKPLDTVPFPIRSPLFAAPPTVESPASDSLVSIWTRPNWRGEGRCRVRARDGWATSLSGSPFGPLWRLADGTQGADLPADDRLQPALGSARAGPRTFAQRDFLWLKSGGFRISSPTSRVVLALDAAGIPFGELSPPQGFVAPGALAVDEPRDRLYVSDPGTSHIHVFTVAGRHLRSFPSLTAQALAVLPGGDLATYSRRLGRLAIYSPEGECRRQWMSPTVSIFADIAVDARLERLLVLAPGEERIYSYDFGGRLAALPAAIPRTDPLLHPDDHPPVLRGLCVTEDGLLLVTGRATLQALRWGGGRE